MMNSLLDSSKSYLYLTKNDFLKGFGEQSTVIVAKDYKNIRFNFEGSSEDSVASSLLLSNQKQVVLKNVHIVGDVLRPTQLKLVNTEKRNSDSNLLFCLDDMDKDLEKKQSAKAKTSSKQKLRAINHTLNSIGLFRRRLKMKKFLDLEDSEREKLATCVLDFDRFKDKSMFHFINEKRLVLPKDYEQADFDFITLNEPPDSEYEQNYSQEASSIHDLFDIEIADPPVEDATEEYEMEYLEDDEDA